MDITFAAYESSRVKAAVQQYPSLPCPMLVAIAGEKGYSACIADLAIEEQPHNMLMDKLVEHKPRFVGIASTIPLFPEGVILSNVIRDKLGKEVTVNYGGPHGTAPQEESLRDSDCDIIVRGDGEDTFIELLTGQPLAEIAGI